MKKNLTTIITVLAVILLTGSFSIAEGLMVANSGAEFPYFHLGTLLIGGLILISLQQKYPKLRLSETVGSFALYTVLVALFTNPVINVVRNLIG